MAFVVARPGRRFEIRESVATPAGPRARTLATFRTLSSDVLARAEARARRPFDAAKIRARAVELGAGHRTNAAAVTAQRLLGQLREGEMLPPALVQELRRVLPPVAADVPDTLDGAIEWVGVDDATRGRTLRRLLDFASMLPQRTRPPASSFPRISTGPPS